MEGKTGDDWALQPWTHLQDDNQVLLNSYFWSGIVLHVLLSVSQHFISFHPQAPFGKALKSTIKMGEVLIHHHLYIINVDKSWMAHLRYFQWIDVSICRFISTFKKSYKVASQAPRDTKIRETLLLPLYNACLSIEVWVSDVHIMHPKEGPPRK